MESDIAMNEYIGDKEKLMSERLIELITDLPLTRASDRQKVYEVCEYENFGYMLLPDLQTATNTFNRNFINFWTKLLRDGPAEKLFNQEFDVFTQERRQFRPREKISVYFVDQ